MFGSKAFGRQKFLRHSVGFVKKSGGDGRSAETVSGLDLHRRSRGFPKGFLKLLVIRAGFKVGTTVEEKRRDIVHDGRVG